MKIALAQMAVLTDRPVENMLRLKAVLARLSGRGRTDLVVFPRLALSGDLNREALSRPDLAPQYRKVWADFLELSREFPDTALALSAFDFENTGDEAAWSVRDGQVLYRQSRVLGGYGAPPEDWPVWLAEGLRIRVLVGGDDRLPGAETGLDLLVTLKNQPFLGRPYDPELEAAGSGFWRLNVGRVGGDGADVYEGVATAYDPEGRLKGWAPGFEEALVELDSSASTLPDVKPGPARAPAAVLAEALTVGVRDFVRVSGFKKVLLGLSGGLDSAVVAALAVRALGPDQVLGVALPSEFNAPESLTLARELAANLKMPFLTIPITAIKKTFLNAFPQATREGAGLADENLQARIRGVLLMYLANREERLLLATGNKSEGAVGYSTLYGDTCGALAPIGDVYKVRVYDLARHFNESGPVIPEGVITRPPSAELRPGQKDQDSLPPYDILDDILARHLEGRQHGSRIAREGGHSALTVAWALSALKRSTFKRAQCPPVLVVTPRPLPRI